MVMEKLKEFCEKFADRLIWIFIAVYVSIFAYLCFLKYASFSYLDWDFASDTITLWNSIHGRMLYYPFLEEVIFGGHLYLIILLLIPLYAIFQHPMAILFLQSIFLGLAAYPLYALARLKLNKTFALAIGLAYLLYPSLGYINLFETHFEIYEIFFLFFSLYYFEKEDYKKFLIFVFLASTCKENVSLVVFMFGIYALLRKRSKKWVLVPSALGLTWFFLAIKFIIPYFAKDAKLYQGGFIFSAYYHHLGNNISDMMKTIIIHPIAITKYAFTQRKILYLLKLFLPTGLLGFLSPTVLLITVPIFMQNLLSAAPTHAEIYFQYVALLIPFIFASTIYGCSKLLNHNSLQNKSILLAGFLLIVIASGIFLGAPQFYFARYIKAYQINDFTKEKDKIVKLIPKDASIIATFQFLPKLAHRYGLYSMHFISTGFKMYTKVKYQPPVDLEYALIDFNEPLMISSFFPPEAPANIRLFLENGKWKVLKAVDDIVLFKKNYQNGNELCEIVQNPIIKNVINANIGDQIIFLGYDFVKDMENEGDALHLAYYWKRIAKANNSLVLLIQFMDAQGNVIFNNFHAFGYRIYPMPINEITKEHHTVFIPPKLKNEIYSIRAGLISLEDGKILPVLTKNVTDNLGRIILK